MRFNTHNRTPKKTTKKSKKFIFTVIIVLLIGIFLLTAIESSSIIPIAVIILIITVISIITKDLNKAYVEVIDNKITVTDYYFGVRKEKNFLLQDIASSEIVFGESINNICSFIRESDSYIVFRDKNGKYMFKILCAPETKQFFANNIDTSIKFYQ